MTKTIAGIGHRDTPLEICKEMIKVGSFCRENNIKIYSGHAEGADYSFEIGAREALTAFLPWPSFNQEKLPMLGKPSVIPLTPELSKLVDEIHPKPQALTYGARKMMCRNVPQVLGPDLKSPVNAVVCFSRGSGGTEFALRLARKHSIPIINMFNPTLRTSEAVIKQLLTIFKSK